MLSLGKCYRHTSDQTFRILAFRSIKPEHFSPVLSNVLSYSNGCSPPPSSSSSCEKPKCPSSRRKQGAACAPPKGGSGSGSRQITYRSYVRPPPMDHDYKNMALKRPMSPALDVVTMTVPATMSIYQRITGIILTGYALLLAGGTLFLPNGIETYVSIIQSFDLSSTTILILKILAGLPFSYHYFNGIRFCLWNAGKCLDLKQVSTTAMVAMVLTFAGAVAFAFQ